MKRNPKSTSGFTLVELCMVMGIMATLMSILVPRMGLLIEKSYQARAKGNLGMEFRVQRPRVAPGRWPPVLGESTY